MGFQEQLRSRPRAALVVAAVVSATAAASGAASTATAAGRLSSQRLHAQPASSAHLGFSPRAHATMPLRVPNPKAYALAKAAAARGYRAWIARHPQSGGATVPAPRTAAPSGPRPQAALFEGLNQGGMFGGGENTSVTPPDTTGAIGPNDYIEIVNSEVAVYNRATLGLVRSMSEESFANSTSTCDGQIRWDQQAERWEYVVLDCGITGTEGFSFGWSKTLEPGDLSSASWCKYHVETGKQLFDYPKLGGDDDFLLVGVNVFAEKTKPAEEYVGSGVVTISKPAKGRTSCPSGSEIELTVEGLPVFTPVPANVYGPSSTGYVVASEYPETETSSANKVDLFTVTKNGAGEPAWHAPTTVSVSSYFFPPGVPQPASTDTIDSSDTRLTQAVAAEDVNTHLMQIWTQHTVSSLLGTPSVVRWYELKPGSSTPTQEGTVAGSAGDFAFNAAISPTTRGNGAAIDYNVGGPTQEVQLHGQSRGPATTGGTMAEDVTLAESEGVDDDFSCPSVTAETAPCRWGDYAGASPDPLHPGVVWGTGELNGKPDTAEHNARWKTENFALTLHAPPGAGFTVATASPSGGTPVEFDGSSGEDPAEPIAAYEWSFGDGTHGSGRTPTHIYAQPGTYEVTLTVMDEGGVTSTATHEVTVADSPPVASFAIPSAAASVPVTFDGATSHDPDGTVAAYEWEFGDGSPVQTGASASHTFTTAGVYTVKLKVTDDKGLTGTVEHEVTVAAAPATTTAPAPVQLVQSVSNGTLPEPFAVISVKRNGKTGGVAITVHAPGAGLLQIGDANAGKRSRRRRKRSPALIVPLRMAIAQAGNVTVQLLPSAAANRLLGHRHAVTVKALIVFTPPGGKAVTVTESLVLKRTGKRHRRK
jgi:PKD repeat protein